MAALAAVLWQLDKGVPRFAHVRLERALSQGRFSFHFEHVSVNVLHGVTIRNVRVHTRHTIDPPLITIDKLHLGGRYYLDRPFYTWVKSVEADGFVCRPFLELPKNEHGFSFAEFLRLCSVENDWLSEPMQLTIRNADIFTVKCDRVDAQVRAEKNQVVVDPIQLQIRSRGFDESLSGWVKVHPAPWDIQARLRGTLTPEVVEGLIAFLGGETANVIARRVDNYTAPLQVSGEVIWKSAADGVSPATQDFRAAASGGGLTYRGVPLRDLRFGVQWYSAPRDGGRERRLSVAPVEFGFEDGSATLSLAWYPSSHATDLKAEAVAPPEELAQVIWGRVPSVLTNFTFQATPQITARGRLMPAGLAEKSAVFGNATVAAAAARGIPLEDVAFDFGCHDGDRLDFTNITARVFDGTLNGHVRVADYDDDPSLDLDLAVTGANCLKVRRHFLGSDLEGDGSLTCHVGLRGPVERRGELTGEAGLEIRGGNLLRIPLFAGLTDFIGRNVPGMDLLLMQSDADVACTLTNGLVTIERVSVSGNLFSLVANGRCRINKEGVPIDMLAQLRFFHSQSLIGMLARLVTLPVSKMMEFRVTGPIGDPEWSYIGLIDRIKSIFWTREDATALEAEQTAPAADGAGEGSK